MAKQLEPGYAACKVDDTAYCRHEITGNRVPASLSDVRHGRCRVQRTRLQTDGWTTVLKQQGLAGGKYPSYTIVPHTPPDHWRVECRPSERPGGRWGTMVCRRVFTLTWPSGVLCTRSETIELCLDCCVILATTLLALDILWRHLFLSEY